MTDSVQVGIRPRGVAVDTDTHSAYVASEGSNWADEIGMTSPGQYTPVRRLYGVSWGPGPSSVAVDWRTHAVYFGEVLGQRVTLVYGIGPLGQTLKETIPMGAAVYGVGVDSVTTAPTQPRAAFCRSSSRPRPRSASLRCRTAQS